MITLHVNISYSQIKGILARSGPRVKDLSNFLDPDPNITFAVMVLYVQEVVTQPKILNRTILSNIIHVT